MKKVPPEIEAEIVRLHFGESMRIGEIARLVGVHHSVVRRLLAATRVPAPSFAQRPRKIDPYRPWLEDMLEKYPKICASRLFFMIRERGYGGGLSQLRQCVRELRPSPKPEAFLRLHKLPAEEAQVDWGHFGSVVIGRAVRPLVAFTITLSYSRAIYLRFFHDAKMPNFQTGHVQGFRFLGGVPRTILFDNLKSAVLERVGHLKRFNLDMLALAKHYRFEPKAAQPYRGNEKGRVERSIRYIRDSFFAAREFVDLEQLNAQALEWCIQIAAQRPWAQDPTRIVQEVWEEEKAKLRPLPDDDFPVFERVDASVGKTPYIRFDKNDYSVPHIHVRQVLTVMASNHRVRVMQGENMVADHPRCYSRGEVIEQADHVNDLITWKRQANESSVMSRLIQAAPSAQRWLEVAAQNGHSLGYQTRQLNDFLKIYGATELESALAALSHRSTIHLSTLQRILDDRRHKQGHTSPASAVSLPSKRLENVVVRVHDLSRYTQLEPQKGERKHGDDSSDDPS